MVNLLRSQPGRLTAGSASLRPLAARANQPNKKPPVEIREVCALRESFASALGANNEPGHEANMPRPSSSWKPVPGT